MTDYIKLVEQYGSIREAARMEGINYSTFHYRLTKQQAEDSLPIVQSSTCYKVQGEDGEVVTTWVRRKAPSAGKVAEQSSIERLLDRVENLKPIKWPALEMPSEIMSEDLLPVYLFTDVHIGLRTWANETGENFDLHIFKEMYSRAFDSLLDNAPLASEAYLILNGDILHWDGHQPVTPRSQHVLDADGRTALMMDYAFDFFTECCAKLLQTYPKLTITCLPGNHDESMGMVLRKFLARLFWNEDRVTVEDSSKPVQVKSFGNNVIFNTHGHIVRFPKMAEYCAAEYPKEWGAAEYRVGYIGHLHTLKVEDRAGMITYQLPTLTPPDSHGIGFTRAQRSLMCHTYHKAGGIWRQDSVTPSMLEFTK